MWTDFLNGPTIIVIPTLTVVACMFLLWKHTKIMAELRIDIQELSSRCERLELVYKTMDRSLLEIRQNHQEILETQASIKTELKNLKEFSIHA